MKRTLVILFLGALAAGIAMVAGCSSDDKSNDNPVNNSNQGQLTDDNFLFVSNSVGETSANNYEVDFNLVLALLNEIDLGGKSQGQRHRYGGLLGAQEKTVVITLSNDPTQTPEGWYVFTFNAQIIEEMDTTYILGGTDSIRILLDGTPVEWVGESTDLNQVQARAYVPWFNNNGEDGKSHHTLDVVVDVVGSDSLATVDASVEDSITGFDRTNGVTCDYIILNDALADNIVVLANQNSDECPRSGTVDATVSVSLDCEAEGGIGAINLDGVWNITATFNADSTVTFDYSHGPVKWHFVVDCDSL